MEQSQSLPHRPMAVARTLIKKAEEAGYDITHLQLQKMLYFSHALMLGCYNRPLLDTEFQAWKYGPVMPEVYRELKSFGDLPIDTREGSGREEYDGEENEVIQEVFDYCKRLHGFTLVRMTHAEDAPWALTWNRHKRNANIPDRLIREYFSQYYPEDNE